MKLSLLLSLLLVQNLACAESGNANTTDAMPMEHHHHHDMKMDDGSGMDHSSMDMEDDSAMEHSKMDMGEMHDMSKMNAMLGQYAMTREASGTSWQPDSSPHEGIHEMIGDWSLMVHGYANLVYDRQSGPRGDEKTFSESMLMVMGQRSLGAGTLGLRGMFSLDPAMGKSGYPELFQTGETADGTTPLIDRQHPHDLAMELAATYSIPVSQNSSVFGYVGLPGEPALGPTAFMHRFSGVDNPEAPITHHWLDSTHITYGVITFGYIYKDFKIETSAFHGREPDQFRWNIETGALDSNSIRLSYNPTPNWSGQISYGHIESPEQLEPDIDVNRTTASITNNQKWGKYNWQTTLAYGHNVPSEGEATNAFLLESALKIGQFHTVFGRYENVDKDELFDDVSDPHFGKLYKINKASLGYVYDFPSSGHYAFGLGGVVSGYSIPPALKEVYGSNPNSMMVFARVKIK